MEQIVTGAIGLAVGLVLLAARDALTRLWVVYGHEEWQLELGGRFARPLRAAIVAIGLLFIGLGLRAMLLPA